MAWTTPDAVLALTGETVTAAQVAIASAMIDTKAGTSEDLPADALSGRDRKILAKATAWQAVWIKGKPGLLTDRESHRQASAAGVTTTRPSDSSILYAPMALLELRNLSWLGTRTEAQPPVAHRLGAANFLSETSDECGRWQPL